MIKNNQKRVLSFIVLITLLISNFLGGYGTEIATAAETQSTNKTLDIIEITDFHGQLLDSTNTKPIGAALSKSIKDVKRANPNGTLIIGGGDLYQGTPVSNVLRGVPVQEVLSNIGMEVTALGNHEFDWGLDVVNNTTMTGANYSIVCANLYNKNTTVRPYAPYKIITKNGVRIAVIGAILKEAPTIIMPAFAEQFDFKDPATEINACAKEIIDGNKADIILADIHDGGESLNSIVNNLHGVDAVFGGHTHTTVDDSIKDGDGDDVPTLIANSTGKGYIDLKITVDSNNKIVSFSPKGQNYKGLTVTTSSEVDPECKAIVDKASANLLPIFNEVIGKDTETYTSSQSDSPYGESQLGNWMADVVKNNAKADVGMVNNGGIRLSSIPAGNVTVGTIFNLMPFDNTITTVKMTGAQLKVVFEQALADTTGKGIQISGVKLVYDSSKQSYKQVKIAADGTITTPEVPGQRVTSIIRESDNSIVKDTDTLLVAAPDFVSTGGDGFTEFKLPEIKETYIDSHILVRDALNADLREKGKISVVMNNRIDNKTAEGTAVPMTIAQARTAKGVATITGYVSVACGKTVFIQDNLSSPTAGICVYNSAGATINKGDKITVTGPLSIYNELVEITPEAGGVTTISSGNVIIPKEVTLGDINTTLQGQLVKFKNVKFTSIQNSGSSIVQDSTGSLAIYKMPVVAGLSINDTADVTGAVSQYKTTIQLAVNSASDVLKTSGQVVTPPASVISVVATSDVHGNILNFDYGTNAAPSKGQGLAKVSTYVNNLRMANKNNVMLIDNGDTIQGTPLVYYYNMIDKATLYPMAAVMGAMKYDTQTLGNHEFNYGLSTLSRVINDYKNQGTHVLSANTYNSDNTNFVEPYYIKSFTVNGKTIKVGVLGLTTKTIPSWENPNNYAGLHFNDLVTEAQKWVPKVKSAGADIVIVAAHSGLEGASDVIPENQVKALANNVSGIDAIIAGHSHSAINDLTLKNPDGKIVPVVEPGKWANAISQVDIGLDITGNIQGITTKNVYMDSTIVEDPAITKLIAPYQAKTLEYTARVLGQSTGEYKGNKQITEPTEIMELINKVQSKSANTQLSIAAPLSSSAHIPTGDITIKDTMGVYVYENFLFGVKMTGKQIKDWMEYTARYYKQVSNPLDPIVKDSKLNIADYNLDQLYGASYDIDLTEAACTLDSKGRVISGNRIKNLKFNGNLIKDTDVFTVAINNYRFNGGGGFMAAAGIDNTDTSIVTYDSAKTLGDDGQVRSLMMKYIQDNKTITPTTSNNWKLYTTALDPKSIVSAPKKITVTINGDSKTTKSFTWYSDKSEAGSQVQIVKKTGLIPDFTNANEFTGISYIPINTTSLTNIANKDEIVHKATATGLLSDTQYWFRVGDKKTGNWSEVGTLKTSPDDNKAFTFIQLTDTQASTKEEADISANTIDQALKTFSNAEFINHTGDIIDKGNIEGQWDWLLNGSKSSLLNTTIMPAAGNHESQTNSFIDHFNLPVVAGQDTSKGDYYSYDYGNAHFIVLNTNDNASTGTIGPLSEDQINWLKADVAASDKQWKILSMHKGIYTTGKHLDDADIMKLRDQLVPLMDTLNIDLVFQGHDHTYARSKFLAQGAAQATTKIIETMNNKQIEYAVNPNGKMYITVNSAGPKVYGPETSNTYVTLADYFSLFERNEQPAEDPKYPAESNGDPKRGVVQQFAGVTIEGNKLTYMAYKIEGGQTTLTDTYGIVKVDEPTEVNNAIASIKAVVTLSDKDAIVKIRSSYEALSKEQKVLIKNLKKLIDSETKIAELEKQVEKIVPQTPSKILVDKINVAPIGSTTKVDLTNNSVASKDLFNTIKGQDKNITFQKDGISWTFNGKDIASNVTGDIDLSLKVVPDALKLKEIAKVKAITGKDTELIPFSFNYDGQLPGMATVKIYISKDWAGKLVTISRYFEDKDTYETITSSKVDGEGYVSINLDHCSDYFVTQGTQLTQVSQVTSFPKTGSNSDMEVLVSIEVAFASLCIMALMFKRRKRRKLSA